jgi:hypothetical protein
VKQQTNKVDEEPTVGNGEKERRKSIDDHREEDIIPDSEESD